MPKQVYIVAAWLTLGIALVGTALYAKSLKGEFEEVNIRFGGLRELAAKWTNEIAALKDESLRNGARLKELEQEKQAVESKQKKLEDEMRGALESRDVTISQLQGKLTVSILDRVLFDSGEAVLKPDGEAVLSQIAAALSQYTNRLIHVIGHTDNIPIRGGKAGMWTTGISAPPGPRRRCVTWAKKPALTPGVWRRWAKGSFIRWRTIPQPKAGPETAASPWWSCPKISG